MTIKITRHFEQMNRLVSEGIRCKQAMAHYESMLPNNLTEQDLVDWNSHHRRYTEVSRQLRAKPEDLAEKWKGAKQKLKDNKVYPCN